MEGNELMLGNYYKPTDGNTQEYTEVTVDDLRAWSIGAIYGKPIPLTEEWLVKFGFKKIYPHDLWFELQNHDVGFFGVGLGSKSYSYRSCLWTAQRIQYVHQLQNLYFALTGTHLTLNPTTK